MEREAVVRAWHRAAVGACVLYGVVALSLSLAERTMFEFLGLDVVPPFQVAAAGLLLSLAAPGAPARSYARRALAWASAALLAVACAYLAGEWFLVPSGGAPPPAASALPWVGLGLLALLAAAGAALDGPPVRYRRPAGAAVAWSLLSAFAVAMLATLLFAANPAGWPLSVFVSPLFLLFASPLLAIGLAARLTREDDTPGRAIGRCTLLLATAMAWTSVLAATAWGLLHDRSDPAAWGTIPLLLAAAVAAAVSVGLLGRGLVSLRPAR